MTEIQEAFEKWAKSETTKKVIGNYSLEPWRSEWKTQQGPRVYASMVTERDYRIFEAGWEARGKV